LSTTIQKQGTAKTTASTPHTCPPETHFWWKQAGGAKYLRLKYRNTADSDPKRIQATEKWRASRALRARARARAATDIDVNTAEEALAEDNPTHAIMRMYEINAELDRMQRARIPYREIRQCQEELMAPRLKVMEMPM
jgi:hypothetical protein